MSEQVSLSSFEPSVEQVTCEVCSSTDVIPVDYPRESIPICYECIGSGEHWELRYERMRAEYDLDKYYSFSRKGLTSVNDKSWAKFQDVEYQRGTEVVAGDVL